MQDYKTICDMCAEQEEKFQFERFSRRDALNIGLKLIENAEKQAQPVAVEITVNGLVVFRYFMEGSRPESELWLARKRNAVELTEGSSLRMFAEMEAAGQTFADRKRAATTMRRAAASRSRCAARARSARSAFPALMTISTIISS